MKAELDRLLRPPGLAKVVTNDANQTEERTRAINAIAGTLHAKFGRFLPVMLDRLSEDVTDERASLYRELSSRLDAQAASLE